MSTGAFDHGKAEAFGEKMVGVLNDSFLGLMTSIGHQTGLFDTMAGLSASTSAQIAAAAKLNERYVREWLGAMVLGGFIEYDPASSTYTLPPEHAQSVTRASGPDNLAFYTSYIALLGEVEQQLIGCFRNGGGAPYEAYPRFQPLQAEETAMVHDLALIEGIVPLAPGIVQRLESGIAVADIGCGQGHTANLIAQAFPNSRIVGYDLSETGVAAGNSEAQAMGLSNAIFEVADVTTLNTPNRFDLITAFDVIHDLAHPREVLKAIAESLKPGGTYFMGEYAASSNLEENSGNMLGPTLFGISVMYCMTTSLAYDGEGLGTMWGEQKARELLEEAGFADIQVAMMEGDPFHNFFVSTKR
jgi:SAM-dependent methyltransferase